MILISKVKNILKKLDEINRIITYSPSEIDSTLQSNIMGVEINDKTNLSEIETLIDLLKNANSNVRVSFVNKYSEKTPELGINPNVKYKTPHGIYSYPLDKENLIKLIYTGSPTDANFATNMEYIHVFSTDDESKVKIKKDGSSNFYNDSNSIVKYENDIIEIIKKCLIFAFDTSEDKTKINFHENDEEIKDLSAEEKVLFFENKFKEKFKQTNELLNAPVNFSLQDQLLTYVSYLYVYIANIFLYKKEINSSINIRNIFDEYEDLLLYISKKAIKKYSSTYRSIGSKTKSTYFHNIYFYCFFMSYVIAKIKNETKNGTYFTLLLNLIGIKSVVDHKTSTIHPNEPDQAVESLFVKDKRINLIGTYKNIFKNTEHEYIKSLFETLMEQDPNVISDYLHFDFTKLRKMFFDQLTDNVHTCQNFIDLFQKNIKYKKVYSDKFKSILNNVLNQTITTIQFNDEEKEEIIKLFDYIKENLNKKYLINMRLIRILFFTIKDFEKTNFILNLLTEKYPDKEYIEFLLDLKSAFGTYEKIDKLFNNEKIDKDLIDKIFFNISSLKDVNLQQIKSLYTFFCFNSTLDFNEKTNLLTENKIYNQDFFFYRDAITINNSKIDDINCKKIYDYLNSTSLIDYNEIKIINIDYLRYFILQENSKKFITIDFILNNIEKLILLGMDLDTLLLKPFEEITEYNLIDYKVVYNFHKLIDNNILVNKIKGIIFLILENEIKISDHSRFVNIFNSDNTSLLEMFLLQLFKCENKNFIKDIIKSLFSNQLFIKLLKLDTIKIISIIAIFSRLDNEIKLYIDDLNKTINNKNINNFVAMINKEGN